MYFSHWPLFWHWYSWQLMWHRWLWRKYRQLLMKDVHPLKRDTIKLPLCFIVLQDYMLIGTDVQFTEWTSCLKTRRRRSNLQDKTEWHSSHLFFYLENKTVQFANENVFFSSFVCQISKFEFWSRFSSKKMQMRVVILSNSCLLLSPKSSFFFINNILVSSRADHHEAPSAAGSIHLLSAEKVILTMCS